MHSFKLKMHHIFGQGFARDPAEGAYNAPVLAGELSLSPALARLMSGRVTTLWVKRPLSVNQHGQLSLPSLRGRLNE